MKFVSVCDHHNAATEWERRDLYEWLTDIFEAPHIKIQPKKTQVIRDYVRKEFQEAGWAYNLRIDPNHRLTVFSYNEDLAFQLQTGNMSRAFYDLLKLQYLYTAKRINAAAIALPTREAAKKIGSNIANADRVWNELQLLSRVITVPIVLIAFE